MVLDMERDEERLVDSERLGGEADVQVVPAGRGHEPQDLLLHHGAGLDLLQVKEVDHWWNASVGHAVDLKMLLKTITYVNSDLCRGRSWEVEDGHHCPLLVCDQLLGLPQETESYRDPRGWGTIRKTKERLITRGQRLSINHTDTSLILILLLLLIIIVDII